MKRVLKLGVALAAISGMATIAAAPARADSFGLSIGDRSPVANLLENRIVGGKLLHLLLYQLAILRDAE